MLTEILVEALMGMDDKTLNGVLESCSEEELEILDNVMEMSKADFRAENINTFKRNDYLNSFKLDNGTGLNTKYFKDTKDEASSRYGRFTLDDPNNVKDLRMRIDQIGSAVRQQAVDLGMSPDVVTKAVGRAESEYLRHAIAGSKKAVNKAYAEKTRNNFNGIKDTWYDPDAFQKMAKSYVAWAKRENAKLQAKDDAQHAKQKLLAKLDKLKPSDLKK